MKEGTIYFDGDFGRYALCGYHFHCGDCLQIWIDGRWQETRIEMHGTSDWMLIGYPDLDLDGLRARRDWP